MHRPNNIFEISVHSSFHDVFYDFSRGIFTVDPIKPPRVMNFPYNATCFTKTRLTWDTICSSKFIADKNHQNLPKFIQKANTTSFNEAVIIDIVKSQSDYTLTFLDTYSSFAVSTCIESVEKGEVLDHIENLWINIFNSPCTFICSTNTAISTIFKSEEDLTIPILFLDETWVINDLNEYYRKFTHNFFRIERFK